MIPVVAVYLFLFVAGMSVGWIITHCILGYRYEKLIKEREEAQKRIDMVYQSFDIGES